MPKDRHRSRRAVDSLVKPLILIEGSSPSGKYSKHLAVLAGPSFAKEMAQNQPTNVTVASKNKEVATRVRGGLQFCGIPKVGVLLVRAMW